MELKFHLKCSTLLCTPIHPPLPPLSDFSHQNKNSTALPALQLTIGNFNPYEQMINDVAFVESTVFIETTLRGCLSWKCNVLFEETTSAFIFFFFRWGLVVAYSCRPGNIIIWEKSCNRWQAVFSTSVWKSLWFSNTMLSGGHIVSFCFPPPVVLNWKTQWWTH